MSREIKLKYFLEGKEVEKEAINWNRSLSVSPVKNSNEVHITYLNFEAKPEAKTTPACGLSTRHKACGQGYPAIKIDKDKLQNILKEFEFFDNAVWNRQEEIGTPATPYQRTESADELFNKAFPRPTAEDLTKVREALNRPLDAKPAINEALQKSYNESVAPLGVKHNKHKAPLDIVQTRQFGKALQMIALATAFGNKKYEATDKDFLNFKRVAGGSQTYFDAAARHNTERNEIDEETGLPHVIHAVWDMLAGLEMYIEENKLDVKEFSKNYLENLHKSK